MIENRPKSLLTIPDYVRFPGKFNLDIDFRLLPPIFNLDLNQLNGVLPLTESRFKFIGKNAVVDGNESTVVMTNPSEREIEYFKSIGVSEFQLINIVFSLFNFKRNGNDLLAMPYAVSLVPGSRGDKIDPWELGLVEKMDIEKALSGSYVFTEFDPFSGWYGGLVGDYRVLTGGNGIDNFTDSIGFVWGQYLLCPVFDSREVKMSEDSTAPATINSKFRKYRAKMYFEPFKDTKPRRLWGCESPIELFILQALARDGILPQIQTLIFRNGSIFPNYHLMIEDHEWIAQDRLLTNVDFYFPNQKVAVFCDGSEYHQTAEGQVKDKKIDGELGTLGIRSLRFSGKEITENLEKVVEGIKTTIA